MRSSVRRTPRRDRPSNALTVIGNLLLLLATLAVAGLVAYLVLYPPGVLKEVSQDTTVTAPATTTSAAPEATTPAPAPAQTLAEACGGVTPLLDQADTIVTAVTDNPAGLDSATIADVAGKLQTAGGTAPAELKTLIDPLAAQLVELNNAVLAGEEQPDFDSDRATASTDAARTLCQG